MTENKSDESIVGMYWERDEKAIARTKDVYGKYIASVIRGILPDRADAEECENDVYLALWNAIPPARPKCFKAFLTKIARARAIDRYRSDTRKKRSPVEYAVSTEELCGELGCPDGVEEEYENLLLRDSLDEFLHSLDKKRRYVFVSRYVMSSNAGDIARELGVSESTVFHDLKVMRKQLKEKLEKEGLL